MFGLFKRKAKPKAAEATPRNFVHNSNGFVGGFFVSPGNIEPAPSQYEAQSLLYTPTPTPKPYAEASVNVVEPPTYIPPRYDYDDAIDAAAERSHKMDSELHWHLYKWCNDRGLIDQTKFKTSVNHMREVYPKHRDEIDAEIERFCNPAQVERTPSPIEAQAPSKNYCEECNGAGYLIEPTPYPWGYSEDRVYCARCEGDGHINNDSSSAQPTPPQVEAGEPHETRPACGVNATITFGVDQAEPSPPAEVYPLPEGQVALKDPRFDLLSAHPGSCYVSARQPGKSGHYWFVSNAIAIGEGDGLSDATLRQCKLWRELAPIVDEYEHYKARPEDLDLSSSGEAPQEPAIDLGDVIDVEYDSEPLPESMPEPLAKERPLTEREKLIADHRTVREFGPRHRIIVIDKKEFNGGRPIVAFDVLQSGSKVLTDWSAHWKSVVIHGPSWMVELPETNGYCGQDHHNNVALETFAPITLSR